MGLEKIKKTIKTFFRGEDDYLKTYEDTDSEISGNAKKKIGIFLFVVPVISVIIIILVKASMAYYDYHYGKKTNMEIEPIVEEQKNTSIKVDDVRIWRVKTEKEQEKLNQEIVNVKSSIGELDKKLEDTSLEIQETISKQDEKFTKNHQELIDAIKEQAALTTQTINQIGSQYDEKLNSLKENIKNEVKNSEKPTRIDPRKLLPVIANSEQSNTNTQAKKEEKIEQVEFIDINDNITEFEVSTIVEEVEEKKKPKSFIMDAGFAKATILAAGEFNTMQEADSDKVPIFFSLDTKVITANGGEADLTGCMLRGAGKGEFATSKVPVKIVKIDCKMIDEDGVHYRISKEVNGAVYDETGGYALKGRLITKEGEIFSKAIPIALLETGLNILTERARNTNNTSNGTEVVNLTGATNQGLASTGQTIVNKMGEYWLDYLDALNPKIDVRPGRQVVIAFFGGEKLEISKYIPADLENFEKGLIDASYIDEETTATNNNQNRNSNEG
jgi:hypothetical protein